ncbi:MAG: ABC transporter substrate-binding protein [Burkholderiales bacterium]|nr:ABC transporter substrate-binding protein [Burkholderiales bacterium]
MKRREFIAVIGAATIGYPLAAMPQDRGRISTVGVLWHAANAEEEQPYFRVLTEGLRKLGYVEGRNIILEHRFPNEIPERFKSMATELVSLNVDVLVSSGAVATFALRDATKTIPVVFIFVPDPVGSKLVESFARPGGNVTGLSHFSSDLIGKRLQFLKETVPRLSRVALFVNANAQITPLYVAVTQTAAAALGLVSQAFGARSLDEVERAFDAMVTAGMQAVMINSDGLTFQARSIIAKSAIERRLPLSAYSRETLEAGALMSYGPDYSELCRRAAVFVDKILKGARPSELPVEQPTKFELEINMKTAKALGISIPRSLLLRADQVIE